MINNYKNIILIILNTLLIFLVLFFFSANGFYFDGIPWDNTTETILILCIFPILFVFNTRYISKIKISYILLSLLILSFTFNLLLPKKGLYFQSYTAIDNDLLINSLQDHILQKKKYTDENKLIIKKIKKNLSSEYYLNNIQLNRTFNSFWNNGYTLRLTKPLLSKHNFPLDWKRGLNHKEWNNLDLEFSISGFIKLDQDEFFIVEAKGLKNSFYLNKINSRVYFVDDVSDYRKFNLSKQTENAGYENINIKNFKLNYFSSIWSFKPYIYNFKTNKLYDAFKLKRITVEKNILFKSKILENFILISLFITELIFFSIFFFWILKTIRKFEKKVFFHHSVYLNWIIIFSFTILPIIIYHLFSNFNFFIFKINDIVKTFELSIAIIIQVLLIFFLLNKKIINKNELLNTCILLILIPSLLYFIYIFSENIYNLNNFPLSEQDDWTTIHIISKLISLGDLVTSRKCLVEFYNFSNYYWMDYIKINEIKEIICNSESLSNIYFHNPLYRYFLTAYFTLFGHGSFALKITDFWAIFFVSIVLIKIIINTNLHNNYTLIIILLYLTNNFAGPYRYLIGRGKEEFSSLFCIFLVIYIFLYTAKNKINFSVALLFSVIALFLRLDFIFLIFSLVFFSFENYGKNIRDIYNKIFNHNLKLILLFITIVTSSLFLLILRSYFITGFLYPIHPSQFLLATNSQGISFDIIIKWINHLNYVFSAGIGFSHSFKFPSLFLVIGSIFLLLLFFQRRKYAFLNLPYSLSIVMVAIVLSFIFFQTTAYPPRSSIHILPFSLIGFLLIFNILNKLIPRSKYLSKDRKT